MQSNYSEGQKFWHTLLLFLMFSTVCINFSPSSPLPPPPPPPSISMLPGAGVVWGEREGLASNLSNINDNIFVYCNVYWGEDRRPTTKGLLASVQVIRGKHVSSQLITEPSPMLFSSPAHQVCRLIPSPSQDPSQVSRLCYCCCCTLWRFSPFLSMNQETAFYLASPLACKSKIYGSERWYIVR